MVIFGSAHAVSLRHAGRRVAIGRVLRVYNPDRCDPLSTPEVGTHAPDFFKISLSKF